MKEKPLNNARTKDGSLLNSKAVLMSVRSEGGRHITPLEPLRIEGWRGNRTFTVTRLNRVQVYTDSKGVLQVERVPHPVPHLSKEEGMALAYEHQGEGRFIFESLLYDLCRAISPDRTFSSNEVWELWRSRGWADPPKRNFVGPTMLSGEKRGWMMFKEMTLNTAGNSHSSEMNRAYVSLISS